MLHTNTPLNPAEARFQARKASEIWASVWKKGRFGREQPGPTWSRCRGVSHSPALPGRGRSWTPVSLHLHLLHRREQHRTCSQSHFLLCYLWCPVSVPWTFSGRLLRYYREEFRWLIWQNVSFIVHLSKNWSEFVFNHRNDFFIPGF